MSNEYPAALRREARRQWLTGRYTDEQIAANLGIPRADTIRDWRYAEDWRSLAEDLDTAVKARVDASLAEKRKQFRGIYDQFGQALEGASARHLRNPQLPARDLRAISSTLLNSQRIRERALGTQEKGGADAVWGQIADAMGNERRRRDRLGIARRATLTVGEPVQPEVTVDAAGRVEDTATRGL